ncbi:hypothetical protein HNO89_004005 [Sporosarcina luteola]|nr:hypothetical protein [Sporosarcina luteola]
MNFIEREVILRHMEDLRQQRGNQQGAVIRRRSKKWKLSAIWAFFL